MPLTFHIENFGCRAARADGEAIAALLRASDAAESQPSEADAVVVNTCSVTAEADREARAYIRRTHRLNPAARIIVTGCYAQRAPEELASIPGVSAVIGNSHKALAPEIALRLAEARSPRPEHNGLIKIQAAVSPQVLVDDAFAHSFLEEAPVAPGLQTRPNLKIQEGCSNRCSFCVIPQTRGNSRSLPAASILSHIRNFVASGGNELVLSGINLGRWGRDLNPAQTEFRSLSALVRALVERTSLPRLRLSSIEPMDWDAELLALMREFGGARIARHAHLPLQSGSDSVLRRMYRRYRPWHYSQKVEELLRAAGPSLTLGADVMVGFPGESEPDFMETCNFIRALPFGYLHLFPFSPRPGTRAWNLHAESPVPAAIVNERMASLRALAAEKTRMHRMQFMGTELDAITLHPAPALSSRNHSSALTENFLPVELSTSFPANRPIRVRVSALTADGTLLASPACSTTYAADFRFDPLPASTHPILETAF